MIFSFFLATVSLFYYVSTPAVAMREQPKSESEVVSQAYFSEEVSLLDTFQDWVKIETTVDHYQGWVPRNALVERETSFLTGLDARVAKIDRCQAHLYSVEDTVYGPVATLPFESKLEVLEPKQESSSRWIKVALVDGREGYIQRGDISLDRSPLSREET